MTHRPDDEGRNVGKLLADYTVQQSRRQSSSSSLYPMQFFSIVLFIYLFIGGVFNDCQ
jgi:hypothetical protein